VGEAFQRLSGRRTSAQDRARRRSFVAQPAPLDDGQVRVGDNAAIIVTVMAAAKCGKRFASSNLHSALPIASLARFS
jgi:hypothetical protein